MYSGAHVLRGTCTQGHMYSGAHVLRGTCTQEHMYSGAPSQAKRGTMQAEKGHFAYKCAKI